MINVNYRLKVTYRRETHTFSMKGMLPIIPKKGEINKESLKVASISYVNNSELDFDYIFSNLNMKYLIVLRKMDLRRRND